MKIEKILAAVDFGSLTEAVTAYTSFFARSFDASVTFIYVIDYIVTPPAYLSPYIEEEQSIAKKNFESLKMQMSEKGIKTEAEVIVGRLHETFDTVAKNIHADMLVLGFVSHLLRRSSSEKLIKGLQMPMLVIRGDKGESASVEHVNIKRILCPVDFSEISIKALNVAGELKDLISSELYVFHVAGDILNKKEYLKSEEKAKLYKQLLEEEKDKLKKFMNKFDLNEPGVLLEGEPGEKIVSFSKEKDIDLIVIGARGLGLIKGMLIGSVTDSVLKTSPCPVLVIH